VSFVSGARVGSLVLETTNPERSARWYQAAFAPGEKVVDSVLTLSQGSLIFERLDKDEISVRDPGEIIVSIQVDDLLSLKEHLITLDLEWVRPVEVISAGLIATFRDADGNSVNVFQLSID